MATWRRVNTSGVSRRPVRAASYSIVVINAATCTHEHPIVGAMRPRKVVYGFQSYRRCARDEKKGPTISVSTERASRQRRRKYPPDAACAHSDGGAPQLMEADEASRMDSSRSGDSAESNKRLVISRCRRWVLRGSVLIDSRCCT